MLNKLERYEVLKFFRLCCIAGPLPTRVDLAYWQLRRPSTSKKCICVVFFSVLVLHTLYKICSLAYACVFVQDVQLHQLVIHAVMAMATSMSVFWYYAAYISDPALFANYAKITLQGSIGGVQLGRSDQLKKEWKIRLREYSLQDLIATSLPYMIAPAVLIITASFVYDPSMRLLVYAALPDQFQSWATFALCTLEEGRVVLVLASIATPIWQLQVISFELISSQLQDFIRKIPKARRSQGIYRTLRSFQLYISMLNNVNRNLIFTWKLVCMSGCVISGYAAIAHFREHPVFGIMYYVMLVEGVFTYIAMYEKAFKIPRLFDQAARCALLRMRGNGCDIFRRQIRSIPRTGVKVGHFHLMKRTSTLIFVDFVLTNIVNMLVAYA